MTSPPVPGQHIELAVAGPSSRRLKAIARPRVTRDGRFAATWRPKRVGGYELWAIYRSQRKEYADDFMCPRFFRVK